MCLLSVLFTQFKANSDSKGMRDTGATPLYPTVYGDVFITNVSKSEKEIMRQAFCFLQTQNIRFQLLQHLKGSSFLSLTELIFQVVIRILYLPNFFFYEIKGLTQLLYRFSRQRPHFCWIARSEAKQYSVYVTRIMTMRHPARNNKGIVFGPMYLRVAKGCFSFTFDTCKNRTVGRAIFFPVKPEGKSCINLP